MAQWFGNLFYLPPHWPYPTWPVSTGYEPNVKRGTWVRAPNSSFYVSRHDRFTEFLVGDVLGFAIAQRNGVVMVVGLTLAR